eukprot:15202_1
MCRNDLLNTLEFFVLSLRLKLELYNKQILNNANFISFPVYQIKYNKMDTFRDIMIKVQNANIKDIHKYINKLIYLLKNKISPTHRTKECLVILNAFGWMENTNEMLKEYKNMLDWNPKNINNEILICILHHLIKNGETQFVINIWNDILNHKSMQLLNSEMIQTGR